MCSASPNPNPNPKPNPNPNPNPNPDPNPNPNPNPRYQVRKVGSSSGGRLPAAVYEYVINTCMCWNLVEPK